MDDLLEQWKDIPGYEGLYQVSSLGRIKSIARVVLRSNGIPQTIPEKVRKHTYSRAGYAQVGLFRNNIGKTFEVHRIVAKVFVENSCGKPHVNHIDGNKKNPAASNLEWVTSSENHLHAYQTLGRKPYWLGKKGSDHHSSKAVIVDGVIYGSARQAAISLGLHGTAVSRALFNGHRLHGLRVEYAESEGKTKC